MGKNAKNFLVSTADFAYYVDDILACTGTTNLNTSLEVSMQEQNVNAGKGNKLVYSFKYGRELSATLEAADWKLEYLSMATGSKIAEGLTDVYKMGECVILTNGVGILTATPIGDVAIEMPDGSIVTITPDNTEVDLTSFGLSNESVKATYRYNRIAKTLVIDAESTPMTGRLVLNADKHNNSVGKVGSIEIVIPSYQLNGNFTISFTPDGVSSTSLEGKALAVEGDTCADGSVYAYVKEYDDTPVAMSVSEIAATPATINISTTGTNTTATISVIGLKSVLYSNIELDNADCEFVSDTPAIATVDESGVVTAVASGTAKITVTYNGVSDEINVTVS